MLEQLKKSALQDLTDYIIENQSTRGAEDECIEIAEICVPNNYKDRAQCLLDDLSLASLELDKCTNLYDMLGLAIRFEIGNYLLSKLEEIYDNWLLTQD